MKIVHKKDVFDILIIVKTWEDGLVKSCHISLAGGVVFSAPCVFQLWHGTSDGSSKMAQPTPLLWR